MNPIKQRVCADTSDFRRLMLDDGRPVLALVYGGHHKPFTDSEMKAVSEHAVRAWNSASAPWPYEASDRVHQLLGQLTEKELECARLRETLNSIAQHLSSEWPEQCQSNVRAARKALQPNADVKS